MGSSASKASRTAGSAARQYPKRTTGTAPSATSAAPAQAPATRQAPGPTFKPQPQATGSRSHAIDIDASDPDFAQSLRSIGPVQPNPTLSPTSAFNPQQPLRPQGPNPRLNPAIAVLDARSKLQGRAEREFLDAGKRGHQGREFLDVMTVRQILIMRDERGKSAAEIERRLGLKEGVVSRLGSPEIVQLAQEVGRAEREIQWT